MGKGVKKQQCEELVPFRGIAEGIGLFVFSLAAVSSSRSARPGRSCR